MKAEELENALQAIQVEKSKSYPQLQRRLKEDMQRVRAGKPAGNRFSRPAFWLVAAAACLLSVAAISTLVFRWQNSPSTDEQDLSDNITRNTAADSFYVLETKPSEQEAVVQGFDAFLVRRIKPGATVGCYTLTGVEMDALSLRTKNGEEGRHLIRDLNAGALLKLDEEATALGSAFQTGEFNNSDWERLEKIAKFGNPSALRLIEDIAGSQCQWNAQSKTILKKNEELTLVRNVMKWARRGSRKSRVMSIRSLLKVQSPVTLQCWRDLILDEDEDLALLALDVLADSNSKFALDMLGTLSEKLLTPVVRARVEMHFARLSKGIEHDK
ncbi:hypothetical protein ACFL54_04905 [Planctomycetota bacterium]